MTTPPADPDVMGRLREALARFRIPGLVSAYVFGSVAEGRAHRHSDVDIGVLFDRSRLPTAKARFEAQLDLRRDLSPGIVGGTLDVVVLNDASPLLGRRIVGDGVRVYCADDRTDHAFRRDVQLRAADLEPFISRMRRLMADAISR